MGPVGNMSEQITPPQPRKRRRRRALLIVGGCVGALVWVGVVLVIGGSVLLGLLERSDASSGSGAPLPQNFPGDFPSYHAASLSLIDSNPDTAVFDGKWLTLDSQAKVVTFYQQHLHHGDWEAVDARTDPGSTEKVMFFRRKSATNYVGTIVVSPQNLYGVVTIWVCTSADSKLPAPCP